jgi:signal transduction histidine kinase
LRRSLAAIGEPGSEERERAQAALDYLEGITDQALADGSPAAQPEEAPSEGKESFPVSIIIANCAAMFAREAEANAIELLCMDSDLYVHANPVVLMRIARNLPSNAIKYSGGSCVTIKTMAAGDRVLLEVDDDGRGMMPEELAEFSRPYSKVSESSGHGLGLHLVRNSCEEEGFDFEAKSRTGYGCAFLIGDPRVGSAA